MNLTMSCNVQHFPAFSRNIQRKVAVEPNNNIQNQGNPGKSRQIQENPKLWDNILNFTILLNQFFSVPKWPIHCVDMLTT